MKQVTGSSPKRFLVTAGNTREMIDAVRDWGNIFTGNTGFAIANAIAEHGKVDLVTSNAQHLAALAAANRPFPILGSSFKTHADLRGVLGSMLARHKYDAIFMTAAV